MNVRFLISLAVSGAVHAGVFVMGSGLLDHYEPGLQDHRTTGTLTVSVALDRVDTPEADTMPHTTPRRHQPMDEKAGPSRPSQQTPSDSQIPKTLVKRDNERHTTPEDTGQDAPAVDEQNKTREARPDIAAAKQAAAPRQRAAESPASRATRQTGETSNSAEISYLSEFLAELSRYKHYPRSARLSRQQGKVVVELVLRKDGLISDAAVSEGSRYPALNRAALRSVQQMKRFKPFPETFDRSEWRLSVPFKYAFDDH